MTPTDIFKVLAKYKHVEDISSDDRPYFFFLLAGLSGLPVCMFVIVLAGILYLPNYIDGVLQYFRFSKEMFLLHPKTVVCCISTFIAGVLSYLYAYVLIIARNGFVRTYSRSKFLLFLFIDAILLICAIYLTVVYQCS